MRHSQELASVESNDESQAKKAANRNYKQYLLPIFIYLALALIVFWPVTLNITKTVPAGGPKFVVAGSGDIYQNLWNLWWVNYAVFTLHTSPYFTNLLFYPVGSSLVTDTLSPLAGLFSIVFQGVSLGFAYNVILFIDFALSGFFMFLLADYLIKNRYSAFIAGIIFEFSPFHMIRTLFGWLNWTSIEFLPLFALFFLIIIKEKKTYAIFGAALSFVFLFFFGDPEQAAMGTLIALVLLLFELLTSEGRNEIINKKFIVSFICMIILALLIGLPFFVSIINGVTHGALQEANQQTNITDNMYWSTPVLSFFLPSLANNFFSGFQNVSSYYSIFAVEPTERVAYLGYTVLILAALAIISDIKTNNFKSTRRWVAICIIFALLSLGPYVQIGSLPQEINPSNAIPGLYLLYKNIPVLNLIREPGRFNLITMLCLAILAGFGFKKVLDYFGNKAIQKKWHSANYLTSIVTILIMIEYCGIPFSSSYIQGYFLNLNLPSGYHQIATTPGNFSVMVLPILTSLTNIPHLYTGMSMYYQTAFVKPMVGGYTSRENASQQYSRLNIPLSVEAASLQAGGLFLYPSPVKENYTNVTMFFLSRYKTRFVSVINQAYPGTELLTINDYLDSTFGNPIYSDSYTSIWSVDDAVQKAENRSVNAYISKGNWTYGCSGLGYEYCNSTQNTFWYGPDVRAINVSVPANDTHLTMSFTALSLNKNVTLYLFLTSDKHMLGATELPNSQRIYALNLTLSPGLDSLFFVAPNTTNSQFGQTYDFGLKNITFAPRRT